MDNVCTMKQNKNVELVLLYTDSQGYHENSIIVFPKPFSICIFSEVAVIITAVESFIVQTPGPGSIL
jgi:hypothetical protein